MNILADQQIPFATRAFKQFGEVRLIHGREITRDVLADIDILLVRSITRVDNALLADTPVKFVGTATSGYDHIDQEYLNSKGIQFSYAPGSNARSVAEYILSALFVLFEKDKQKLQDSTVGIIGYGHVGSTVGAFLQAMGIACLINDPPLARQKQNDVFFPLEKILDEADIISLHVPLIKTGQDKTYRLIGESELARIKHNAVLINTSRGGVVDEAALKRRIHESSIKTVLDVWENEPRIDTDLMHLVDISTPHIAGYSTDGKLRATEMLLSAACEYFGQAPAWSINEDTRKEANTCQFKFTEPNSAFDMLSHLVQTAYNVMQDHSALQKIIEFPNTQRPGYFDELRKTYQERFEFMHTYYSVDDDLKIDVKLFESLGFKREMTR